MDGTAKFPSCYGWHDKLDPSCRRCPVRESCIAKQGESRPPCFCDLYDADHPECRACLDNSLCSEEHEKMATPKIRIKRPAAVAAAPVAEVEPEDDEPVVEEQVELEDDEPEAEEAEETASPYDELSVEDLRAELTSRGLDATGRRSVLQERLEADDIAPKKPAPVAKPAKPAPVVKTAPAKAAAPVAKVAPKPVQTPAQAATAAQAKATAAKTAAPKPAPVAPKAAPVAIPAKAAEPETDADESTATMLGSSFKEVLGSMSTGMSLVIARTGKNEWMMSLMSNADMPASLGGTSKAATVTGPKLRGDAFWKEVLTPEYYSWYYEDAGTGKPWSQMSADEKSAMVEAMSLTYAASDDPRVNALHQVEALLDSLGIEKYKDAYKSAKARDAIKA